MKTILSLLLILPALCARGELAIYNLTAAQTVVGAGTETTLRHTGLLLWDVDTGQAWQIQAFRVGATKQFVVVDQSGSAFYQAQGRATRTFTAVITATNAFDRQSSTFTFGRNVALPIRPGRTVSLPRTGRFTGYALLQLPLGTAFGPITGAYSFSGSRTAAAYKAGQTLEVALSNARARYLALGYTEAQP